jgi:hypothetical protein
MTYLFQVTVDCADPHRLAEWWAETLGWAVEEQDAVFIRSMIEQGHATEADTVLYRERLVWKEGAAIHHPDDGQRRVLFQLVPESKTVKNRLHLDIRLGDDDVESVRATLESRGASFLHVGRQGPHTWVTMADPEGNEFCIG